MNRNSAIDRLRVLSRRTRALAVVAVLSVLAGAREGAPGARYASIARPSGVASARTSAGGRPARRPPRFQGSSSSGSVSHPRRSPTPVASRSAGAADPVAAAWADSVLRSLSLRGKVGQMFMRWIPGTFAGPSAKDFADARRWITEDSIGGFIISIGPPRQMAEKTNALQQLSAVPLIFGADLEFGPGQRLIPRGTMFPPPMGIAATGDTAASCAHGRTTAIEARAVGIRWTFSPDVDINVIPDNPIVDTRAYGETAADVIRFAGPFIRCAQEAGLLTTAKHLVAKGATNVDSHVAEPVIPFARARLDSAEFLPFRAAQAEGVAAMMSGHVALPRVSGDSVPLSINPKLLQAVVRDEWGFDGIVVTDAMWMGGVTRAPGYQIARAAVLAIRAGNDVILDPPDHRAMIDAIVAAVGDGRLSEARIDSSVRRILTAKARVGLDRGRFVDVARVDSVVGTLESDSLAGRIAQASIVVVRDRGRLLPISLRRGRIVVAQYLDEGERPAPGVRPGVALVAELRAQLGRLGCPPSASDATLEVAVTTPKTPAAAYGALAKRAATADLVILAPYIRPVALKGSIGLPPAVESFYRNVLRAQPRTIVLSMGDPYLLRQIPRAPTYVLGWNPWSPWSERAAARTLAAGEVVIAGRLPVTVAPDLRAGAPSVGAPGRRCAAASRLGGGAVAPSRPGAPSVPGSSIDAARDPLVMLLASQPDVPSPRNPSGP